MCHPCGWVMDLLRKGYTTTMRTSLDLPAVPIVWYPTCPGAPVYEGPTIFRSGWYTQDWANTGLGEQRDSKYLPCRTSTKSYNGPPPVVIDSDHVCGDDKVWQQGGTVGQDPVFVTGDDGVCSDCGGADQAGYGGEMEGYALPGEGPYSVPESVPVSVEIPVSAPPPGYLACCDQVEIPGRIYAKVVSDTDPTQVYRFTMDHVTAGTFFPGEDYWIGPADVDCALDRTLYLTLSPNVANQCIWGVYCDDRFSPMFGGAFTPASCDPFGGDTVSLAFGTSCVSCSFSGLYHVYFSFAPIS